MVVIKKGYIQTEVGVIPEDWDVKSYETLFQFLTTASYSRDELSEGELVKCVHYGDIHTKLHFFIDFNEEYSSSINYENGKKYPFLKDGDVIMADASEDYEGIGKSIEVKNLNNQLAISGLHTFLLRNRNNELVDGFKGYIQCINSVKKSLDRLATGLKVYGVSKNNLKTVLVPVPTIAEQKAIATALNDVDALISNLEKLITKKKALKQGAMQQLLTGKKRLPGFSEKWVERNLGKSSTLKARIGWQGLTTEEYLKSGNYYLVTGTDFKKGYIDWDNCVYVEKERFDQDKNIQVKPNDVLVTKDGTIGKVAFISKVSKPTTLNSGVFVIRPINGSYYPRFFYFILMSNHFQDFLGKLTAGSTISHLYQKDFVHYNFPVPPSIEEQKAIATTLSDMDTEIEALENKKTKYQQIKQGMMQELLTGKTRLI